MQLPRFLLETLKAVRKDSLRSEPLFLYNLNRKILQTSYQPHSQNNIIVSLTTFSRRIEYLHYALDSIYFQTLRPRHVRLYLTKGEYQDIPSMLERFQPWLEIYEVEELGSYKKFIPALQNIHSEELIISLDDDFIYPPTLIAQLYSFYQKNQDSLVGYCGFKNGEEYFNGIAGGMGILWNPKIFNPLKTPFFFDKEIFWEGIYRNIDDAWIVLSALHKGIEIRCLRDDFYQARKDFIPLPNEKIDAVSASGEGKNYISSHEKEKLKNEILKRLQNVE